MKAWEEEWTLIGSPGSPRDREEGLAFGPWRVLCRGNVVATCGDGCSSPDAAKLVAAAPDLARALLAAEWGGRKVMNREIDACCPVCRTYEPLHAPDCSLDGALRKAGAKESEGCSMSDEKRRPTDQEKPTRYQVDFGGARAVLEGELLTLTVGDSPGYSIVVPRRATDQDVMTGLLLRHAAKDLPKGPWRACEVTGYPHLVNIVSDEPRGQCNFTDVASMVRKDSPFVPWLLRLSELLAATDCASHPEATKHVRMTDAQMAEWWLNEWMNEGAIGDVDMKLAAPALARLLASTRHYETSGRGLDSDAGAGLAPGNMPSSNVDAGPTAREEAGLISEDDRERGRGEVPDVRVGERPGDEAVRGVPEVVREGAGSPSGGEGDEGARSPWSGLKDLPRREMTPTERAVFENHGRALAAGEIEMVEHARHGDVIVRKPVPVSEDPAATCRYCGQFPCPTHASAPTADSSSPAHIEGPSVVHVRTAAGSLPVAVPDGWSFNPLGAAVDPVLRARIAALFDLPEWKSGSVGERIGIIERFVQKERA